MRSGVWAGALVVASGVAGCVGSESDLGSRAERAVSGRCFVAFVHGRGDDRRGHSQAQLETYWAPDADGDGGVDPYYSMTQWAAAEVGCEVLRVGYDGGAAFWEDAAAGTVARQIDAWATERGVAPGELTIVAHSMGGLVARWIANQGVQGAPYFDHGGAPYSRVAVLLRSLVTIQTPHAGTEVADALFGEADTWYANRVSDIVELLGVDSGDPAASAMRRSSMEAAAGRGGWMGDDARLATIHTVAGYSTGDGAGTYVGWMSEDTMLGVVWGALCHRSHAINAWLCREDAGEAGDGLVEEWSAAGIFLRTSSRDGVTTQAGARMAGARRDWLRVEHNHHQGRFDWLAATVRDRGAGSEERAYLGSYLGARIRAL